MIRDSRTHETVVINTPEGSSASAGGIERANYEVEKLIRTMRSRLEENYGESMGFDHKMLPFLVRHCAWLITHHRVKSNGRPCERLRGRPYQAQVAEFAEVAHFRDPGKAADPGLLLGKSLASDELYVGTWARVRRCQSICQRHIAKTDLRKNVECASLWNVKSSTEERKVVRHASAFAGMQGTIPGHCGQ